MILTQNGEKLMIQTPSIQLNSMTTTTNCCKKKFRGDFMLSLDRKLYSWQSNIIIKIIEIWHLSLSFCELFCDVFSADCWWVLMAVGSKTLSRKNLRSQSGIFIVLWFALVLILSTSFQTYGKISSRK